MPHQLVVSADKRKVKSWQGTARAKARALIAAAFLAICVCATPARADESAWPTAQAKAYHFDFVPYLDPPAKPAAICLVDSGVNVTPDTPADSPDGPILERTALDGGPGTAADDSWNGQHGTRMAALASAPINGWGTAGAWPGARTVSIRVPTSGTGAFAFDAYAQAIALCTKTAAARRIVAVNLSLSCQCVPSDDGRTRLENQLIRAHSNGLSVIAAAGNMAGTVGTPADTPGVVAVAAGGDSGELCSFSNEGPSVAVVAPGCGVDAADPLSGIPWAAFASGTSGAAATTSIALALLRSYRSDLTWQAAEQLMRSAAQPSVNGPILDVERMFRSAGLESLVTSAKARIPVEESPSPIVAESDKPEDPSTNELPAAALRSTGGPKSAGRRIVARPRIDSLFRVGRRLTISVRNRPDGATLALVLQSRRGEFGWKRLAYKMRQSDTVTLRLPANPHRMFRVRLKYVLMSGRASSPPAYRKFAG